MARIASFLPARTFRSLASEAYRLWLTRAINGTTKTIDGISYTFDVDSELGVVFIDWVDPTYGEKCYPATIAKSWGY